MTALATTHDQLCEGELSLEQPKEGYRFGTDAMLLAASVRAKPGQHILELGAGVGGALLTAAMRTEKVRFTGIEREPDYFTLLEKNIATNKLVSRVTAIQGDVTDKNLAKNLGTFHHVIANPPFYKLQEKHTPKPLRKAARQEEPDGLEQWLKAANRFLKPKGTVTIIHSADRADEIIQGLKKFCGAVTLFPFWPTAGQPAKRVIIQGTKGSKAPLILMPGLVLHKDGDKYYTEKADAVIKHGQSLWE